MDKESTVEGLKENSDALSKNGQTSTGLSGIVKVIWLQLCERFTAKK